MQIIYGVLEENPEIPHFDAPFDISKISESGKDQLEIEC